MCGIAGSIGDIREAVIAGMLDRIRHRGPDDCGYRILNDASMGNTRLSIIDPAGGALPMGDAGGRCTLAYNGEIYGYRDLRSRLVNKGYRFCTESDAEVLFPLWTTRGLEMFDELNGMFAFCLHDAKKDLFLLGRDHFGIKPLVYTIINSRLYFSSESKSFYAIPEWKAAPDRDAWHTFLNIRFPPAPQTLFAGVFKLPPACYMLIRRKGAQIPIPASHQRVSELDCGDRIASVWRYYAPSSAPLSRTPADAERELEIRLGLAVDDQMVADVPVGIFLSGGLDSSALTSFASDNGRRKVTTFCLGFGEPTDENDDAAMVASACATDHRDVHLSINPLDHYRTAVYHMEEPKVNCLQSFVLSREARKHLKVVLSGLGGDELFGGYDVYAIAAMLDKAKGPASRAALSAAGLTAQALLGIFPGLRWDLWRRGADLLRTFSDPLDAYLLLRNGWDHDRHLREQIYKSDPVGRSVSRVRDHFAKVFPSRPSITEAFIDFEFGNKMVDDFLANEDRMSMAHGLEIRVPFLDRRVVEFVRALPLTLKINAGTRKVLLRDVLRDRVPESILRKRKHGFTFNPVLQYQKDLGRYAAEFLTRDRIEDGGIFNYAFVKRILDAKPGPALRWHYFLLWKILGYHLWEEIFIRQGGRP
jgi:asparagine synthase (glutamine-hydrolysing)